MLLRPTASPGLYYLMHVTSGFSLHPDKADCLILDYAGNILRHGPIDAIAIRCQWAPKTGQVRAL